MTKYKFEIQSHIIVVVEAEDANAAREDLIDNLASFADDMVKDPYISGGEECNSG